MLSLSGTYLADQPLDIPSNFMLKLDGTFSVSPGDLNKGPEKYPGMTSPDLYNFLK